ncbi:MAG: anti-sigma factor family protein [Lachnospiraceae bacterium]
MSECDKYQEMISQMLDGELPEPHKTELVKHLGCCPDCRRVYDAFSAISLSLGETAAPRASPGTSWPPCAPGRVIAWAVKAPGRAWPATRPCRLPGPWPYWQQVQLACRQVRTDSAGAGATQAAQFGVPQRRMKLTPASPGWRRKALPPADNGAEKHRGREPGGGDRALGTDGAAVPGSFSQSGGVPATLKRRQHQLNMISAHEGLEARTITDRDDILVIASALAKAPRATI